MTELSHRDFGRYATDDLTPGRLRRLAAYCNHPANRDYYVYAGHILEALTGVDSDDKADAIRLLQVRPHGLPAANISRLTDDAPLEQCRITWRCTDITPWAMWLAAKLERHAA